MLNNDTVIELAEVWDYVGLQFCVKKCVTVVLNLCKIFIYIFVGRIILSNEK